MKWSETGCAPQLQTHPPPLHINSTYFPEFFYYFIFLVQLVYSVYLSVQIVHIMHNKHYCKYDRISQEASFHGCLIDYATTIFETFWRAFIAGHSSVLTLKILWNKSFCPVWKTAVACLNLILSWHINLLMGLHTKCIEDTIRSDFSTEILRWS